MSNKLVTRLASASLEDRFIPHEILGRIFSYCDGSTLAVVARTSLACLELSTKYLYSDLVLGDVRGLQRLLQLPPLSPRTATKWYRFRKIVHTIRLSRVFRRLGNRPYMKPKTVVTPHFSTGFLHSVTFCTSDVAQSVEGIPDIDPGDAVCLRVLALVVTSDTWRRAIRMTKIVALFNPELFLVQGSAQGDGGGSLSGLRQAPALVEVSPDSEFAFPYRDQTVAIVMRNAVVCPPDNSPSQDDLDWTPGPTRYFYDLTGINLDDPTVEHVFDLAWGISEEYDSSEEQNSRMFIWVDRPDEVEQLRRRIDEELEDTADRGRHTIRVSVRPDRATTFWKEAEHGLKRELDWAVFEEA